MQIAFDPTRLDYETLLEMFWTGHDPHYGGASQYRAQLWCHDEAQRAAAEASAARIAAQSGSPVVTPISTGQPFHPAEAYHQKWRLRRHAPLLDALSKHYDDEAQLLASTAAAKLNAHVAGHWVPDGIGLDAFGVPISLLPPHPLGKRQTPNPRPYPGRRNFR